MFDGLNLLDNTVSAYQASTFGPKQWRQFRVAFLCIAYASACALTTVGAASGEFDDPRRAVAYATAGVVWLGAGTGILMLFASRTALTVSHYVLSAVAVSIIIAMLALGGWFMAPVIYGAALFMLVLAEALLFVTK